MKLSKTAFWMVALMTMVLVLACGENDTMTAATTAASALKACQADDSCRECYETCLENGLEEMGECRDGCCLSHGGEMVQAYCEEHNARCMEGHGVSCDAHERRCHGEHGHGGDAGVDFDGEHDMDHGAGCADAGSRDEGARPEFDGDRPTDVDDIDGDKPADEGARPEFDGEVATDAELDDAEFGDRSTDERGRPQFDEIDDVDVIDTDAIE